MSYDDTHCPCGDKKLPDTMLCDACVTFLKDRREMTTLNSAEPVEYRRQAAIILLSLARGRKRAQSMRPVLPPQLPEMMK